MTKHILSAPLFNPLDQGWRDTIRAKADCFEQRARSEQRQQTPESTPKTAAELKRSNSMDRDLKIAEALRWLSQHPPSRT
ncbi:hypothetical protein OIO90_000489 [Microbotryomycetes sp. JL221]|nr:hypothetical protein OIO90_000489 [Microbotryomycetes sp. JL221]